jgi:hypothetical protein
LETDSVGRPRKTLNKIKVFVLYDPGEMDWVKHETPQAPSSE